MKNRIACFIVATLLLALTLWATACGSTSAEAGTADHPCYHVTVYSPAIDNGTYAARRYPKYTITVDSFRELVPDSYEKEYRLLRIPLKGGRFELVSTSLVEIEYY
jgi:lipoprotein